MSLVKYNIMVIASILVISSNQVTMKYISEVPFFPTAAELLVTYATMSLYLENRN